MSNVLDEVVEGFGPAPELLSVMGRSKPAVLALDIGTSGVRAALFDDRGDEVNGQSIRVDSHASGLAELGAIDAEVLLEHVAETLDALFANLYESEARIELIGVSCFWHSLVGVDNAGRPTTPLFGWSDRRAAQAARQLRADYDEIKFHSRTGCRFHPSYWPAKLLRLKTEDPTTFKSTIRWLSFAEYLTLHLFGETAVSVSMASGTGLMDVGTCEWDLELLAALGVDVAQLSEIASDHQTFHKLSPAYAERWPQLSDARMFPAIADGAANNIGAGCSTREKVALMIGTSGAMRVLFEGTPPARIPSELWCYRADRKRVVVGGALSDGGSLYGWLRESFLSGEDSEWIENQVDCLDADAHGLTVLPFWSGERSTGWNLNATGAIIGMTLETRPIEILRAALEAVAYRFALIAQALEPFAPDANIMISGHALSSSPAWVQILADVLGRRLNVSERTEASTRGAALLALEAAGKIRSIEDFSVPVEAVYEPDMMRHARYQVGLERQQQMYQRVFDENSILKSGR